MLASSPPRNNTLDTFNLISFEYVAFAALLASSGLSDNSLTIQRDSVTKYFDRPGKSSLARFS
jgi:hypothetical protein